ncbi:uncharacterized protein LOC106173069 [Lingula anatina]|uniref:Uncharacterized protein LOC106173069 n=1 Tax=Lingula anatina TaxID=7574 RepID=A0A2R2MMZ5_LINAN|nr:uncharacterized protein LOC106173069 [Lingula anatina]|eukprot:XP_023931603.1 uncharacterized protein LOC106173069 [Lingula anatina]
MVHVVIVCGKVNGVVECFSKDFDRNEGYEPATSAGMKGTPHPAPVPSPYYHPPSYGSQYGYAPPPPKKRRSPLNFYFGACNSPKSWQRDIILLETSMKRHRMKVLPALCMVASFLFWEQTLAAELELNQPCDPQQDVCIAKYSSCSTLLGNVNGEKYSIVEKKAGVLEVPGSGRVCTCLPGFSAIALGQGAGARLECVPGEETSV